MYLYGSRSEVRYLCCAFCFKSMNYYVVIFVTLICWIVYAITILAGATGRTPLYDACLVGAADEVERLLLQGLDVNKQFDCSGDTPAHLACSNGHVSVVKVLLAHDASINLQNSEGLTPLHLACHGGDQNVEVIALLLESNVNINDQDIKRSTPLHTACSVGAVSVVKRLLLKGADCNAKDNCGNTPAHKAITHNTSVMRALMEHGAIINLQNSEGLTPLHMALSTDSSTEVIDLLLESNADVNIKCNLGNTALHTYLRKCFFPTPYLRNMYLPPYFARLRYKICQKLFEKGACIDARNNDGETPYDFCSMAEGVLKNAMEDHIVKLKTAGVAVRIDLDIGLDKFQMIKSHCVDELEKMKPIKINDISLCIIFSISNDRWYLRNIETFKKLKEIAYSSNTVKEFPMYGQIIKATYEKIQIRVGLLEKALSSSDSDGKKLFWFKKLPDLVKIKILGFLKSCDLQNLIESG